jgi:two-component system OmpR family sensor kinase
VRWDSFRVRLTLWNMAILALVLGGFGLAFCYSIQSWMSRSIDRELADRVAHPPFRHHPPWDRRGPGGPGDGPRERFRGGPDRPGTASLRAQGVPFVGPLLPGQPPPFREEERDRPPFRGPEPPPESGPPRSRVPGQAMASTDRNSQGLLRDPEAERRASFQWPRLLDMQGNAWGGPNPRPPWDPRTVKAALAGHRRYSEVRISGDRIRVLSAPIYWDGQIVGAIQVARDLGQFDRLRQGQVRMLLILLPLALLVAGVGGLFLTERALRPVHDVTQAAAQIGVEDLSRRLKVVGRDELAELAATFNGMIGRLEAAFEQQRRFTADASHELRTPLARIKVSTSMALAGEQSVEEYQMSLRIADQAADVMERLIQQLMLLARADAGQLPVERSALDLGSVLEEAVAAVSRPGAAPVTLALPPAPVLIDGDADHLVRVFVNLLQNAIRHTPAEGQITLSARAVGDEAVVRVTDTGEGIAPEHLPHLGERFYRVDSARARRTGGCGLGLAISRTIVHAHGGCLAIESEPGRGTVVTVTLPRRLADGF